MICLLDDFISFILQSSVFVIMHLSWLISNSVSILSFGYIKTKFFDFVSFTMLIQKAEFNSKRFWWLHYLKRGILCIQIQFEINRYIVIEKLKNVLLMNYIGYWRNLSSVIKRMNLDFNILLLLERFSTSNSLSLNRISTLCFNYQWSNDWIPKG
jgi:hypothetical protein